MGVDYTSVLGANSGRAFIDRDDRCELAVGDIPVTAGQLAVLEPGKKSTLRALGDTRAMLLGGDHFPTPRYIWWNFVASSQERIERAKERWERQQFPVVPGETEFIPLPHY